MRPELEEARRRAHAAAREFLEVAAEDLAARAVDAAPVDTGTLRGSVSPGGDPESGGSPTAEVLERDVSGGRELEVSVTFSTPYAAAQHEGWAIHHRRDASGRIRTHRWEAHRWPGGGGPKYLERPLLEMAPRYEAALAETVRRAFAGG